MDRESSRILREEGTTGGSNSPVLGSIKANSVYVLLSGSDSDWIFAKKTLPSLILTHWS
jgi:hypothetical protein